MHSLKLVRLAALTSLSYAFAVPAVAVINIFDSLTDPAQDEAAWEASAVTFGAVDILVDPFESGSALGVYNSTAVPGLTITSTGGSFSDTGVYNSRFVSNPFADVPYALEGSGHFIDSVSGSSALNDGQQTEISFAQDLVGFGADFSMDPAFENDGLTVYAYLYGSGDELIGQISEDFDGEFWGFTSSVPFRKVVITHIGDGSTGGPMETYAMDNLRLAAIPEPSTVLALIALGFIAFTQRSAIFRLFRR